jgi:tRNA(Ile)-lysidine synthase
MNSKSAGVASGAVDLLAHVEAGGLIARDRPVVVLLSGGRDSTCLLDVCVQLGARTSALHVNYGLRDEAGADEEHCRALCRRLEVELEVEHPEQVDGNTQAWARDVRYAAGARLAGLRAADLAAGHTATDQVETVLYRLASSPGRRALLGMAPRSGRLVRPLLDVTRADTAAWCRARGLGWVDDASNSDGVFARARVREGLVPALRAVDARAEANILRTAALLRDEAEVLDAVVTTALAGRDRISVEHLRELPPALGRLVVRRLAENALGAPVPRAVARFDDVLALDGALDVGDGARAVVERGVLHFERTP